MKLFLYIIVFLNAIVQVVAQEPIYCKQLTVSNGLMQGDITAIVQDTNRFVWIGGDEGIQRYDGKSFDNYFINKKINIPNGRITDLSIDNQNHLYISSFYNGFGIVDNFNNQSLLFNNQKNKAFGADMIGFREIINYKNYTYACGSNGLVVLKNNEFEQIINASNSALQGNLIGLIEIDKKGQIWLGTIDGINLYLPEKKRIINSSNDSSKAIFSTHLLKDNVANKQAAICNLLIDRKEQLWISTWQPGLLLYNTLTNSLKQIKLFGNPANPYDNLVTSLVEDNDGNIWIGTANNGLFKYNQVEEKLFQYQHEINNIFSISNNSITDLSKDADGNIWVASKGSISIFNPKPLLIQAFPFKATAPITAAITSGDATLWAADKFNLYHIDNKFNLIEKIPLPLHFKPHYDNNEVWCLKESNSRKLLYIGLERGFAIYNKETQKITSFHTVKNILNNPITDIIEINNNELALCRWWWNDNLVLLNLKKRLLKTISMPKNIESSIDFEIANALPIDKTNYYLSTKKGLLIFNTQNLSVKLQDANFKVGRVIKVGNYLAGATAVDGIKLYHLPTGKLSTINKSTGLAVNNTKNLIYTIDNQFWINSPIGLFRWQHNSKNCVRFGEEDGLMNTNLYGNALMYYNNCIVFSNGQLHYLPINKIRKPQPSHIAIIHCVVGTKDLSPAEFSKPLVVPYFENNIQVKFGIINAANQNINYQYRLKGLSNEWLNGNSQFINFTGLPSGNFSLEVKAIDGFLQTTNQQTIIQFTVTRPFYKTVWFTVLCILLVGGLIYYYYRNKLLSILSLQRLRNNISRDLHDEVGSTLSSVSILSTSVLQQMDTEPQKAKEWIQQIGNNARQMLDVMDEIVWTINPKMDSLETIVHRLKEFGYNATEAVDIEFN
ncbi:MAG: two-component regulator propeller domain-containing protein, partial [Chitinophagaceae bacterium]